MTVSCRSRAVNKFSHCIKQDRHLAGACKVMPSMTIWWPKGFVCNKDSESFQVCPALHIVCRCRVEVTLENPFQKVWITSNHSMFRFQPNDTACTLLSLLCKGFDAIWRCTKVALLALINAFKNFIYNAQPSSSGRWHQLWTRRQISAARMCILDNKWIFWLISG